MYSLKKGKTDGPFQRGKSLISTRVTSSVVFFVVVVVIFTGKIKTGTCIQAQLSSSQDGALMAELFRDTHRVRLIAALLRGLNLECSQTIRHDHISGVVGVGSVHAQH